MFVSWLLKTSLADIKNTRKNFRSDFQLHVEIESYQEQLEHV